MPLRYLATALALVLSASTARAGGTRLITGPSAPVRCLAYSPDGKSIVFGSDEKLLRLIDDETHAVVRVIETPDTPIALAWPPNGGRFVALLEHSGIAAWRIDGTAEWATRLPPRSFAISIAYSADGGTVVVGTSDGAVKWVDAATGKISRSIAASKSSVLSVALSLDGKFLATADGARTRIWDAKTGKPVRDAKGRKEESAVMLVTFSPDGRVLAGGTAGGQLRFFTVLDGDEIAHIDAHTAGVRSLVYSLPGDTVLSSSADGRVRLWNMFSGTVLKEVSHGHEVLDAQLRADGLEIASSGEDGMYLWNEQTAKASALFRGPQSPIAALGYVAGANTLVALTETGLMVALDPDSGQSKWVRNAHTPPGRALVVTNDGRFILTTGGLEELSAGNTASRGDIKAWTGADGIQARDMGANGGLVTALAVSADGRTLASASGSDGKGGILIWDLASATTKANVGGVLAPVTALAFASQASAFASGSSDGTVFIIDPRTALQKVTIQLGAPVDAVALSPDASVVVTATLGASGTSKVQAWDANSGKLVRDVGEQPGRVRSLTYSADGWYVLSCSEGGAKRAGEAHLWIAGSWEVAATTAAPNGAGFAAAAFAPDAKSIALAGTDKSIRMWHAK